MDDLSYVILETGGVLIKIAPLVFWLAVGALSSWMLFMLREFRKIRKQLDSLEMVETLKVEFMTDSEKEEI